MEAITWEEKMELCQLANAIENNYTSLAFLKFAAEHAERFDEQAWDMFFTGAGLESKYFNKEAEPYLRKLYELSKSLQSNSMRTAIRMAAFEMQVNDLIILPETKNE